MVLFQQANRLNSGRQTDGQTSDREVTAMYKPAYAGTDIFAWRWTSLSIPYKVEKISLGKRRWSNKQEFH